MQKPIVEATSDYQESYDDHNNSEPHEYEVGCNESFDWGTQSDGTNF